jgi:2-oxoglutarate dehydrogenase E2 component (dihydrolipoamide succinyltransferase)
VSSSPTEGGAPATDALLDVTMPQMGVSVAEGTVVAWHKRVGDWVNADETVCEISTDKIDTEVPAPAAGRIVEILVEADLTVEVGTVLARVATDAVAGEPHPDEHDQAPAATPAPEADAATPAPEVAPSAAPAHNGAASRRHSPVVARIAEAEGVDLDQVSGTGRGGRVRKQDVLAYIEQHRAGGQAAEPATAASAPQPAPLHIESPYREEPAPAGVPTASPEPATAPPPPAGTVSEPLSRMRRSIAEHMVRSLHTAATCTSIVEADMSGIEAARAKLGLSPLPYIARCVIDALREYPQLNVTLEDQTLTRHADVNLGIAVSLGEQGLIVPVVHCAQELSHEGLAARIRELARRARAGELTPDEVRGGTFTITNPGGYGTIASTPIINQPQVAILDLEAVVRRPVVVGDGIAIRPMGNLCLSWDHRALDGVLAAEFLADVRGRIERWDG